MFSVAVVAVALKVFGGGGVRAASVSRLGVREDVISLSRGSCARFLARFGKDERRKIFRRTRRRFVSCTLIL